MSENWTTKKLGEVCELVNGSTPLRTAKEYWDGGDFPWFTIDDIREQGRTIRYTKQHVTNAALDKLRVLPEKSILLCCTASVGEYAITAIPLATNQQFNGLVIKNSKELSPMFLYYFCATLKDKLLGLSGKTTIDFIPISRLKEIDIALPHLQEQKRIVAVLGEAFDAIAKAKENAEKNLANSHELFESQLKNILSVPRKGWETKRLGDLCGIARGGSPRPIQKYLTTASDGINWIKIGDATVSDKYIFKTEQKIIPEGANRSRLVKDGDFLLSNSMSFGRPYIMRTKGCIHDGWLVLSDYSHHLDQDYLYYVLGSKFMFQQFNQLAAGSTVRNLNIELASSVMLPVPHLKEQKEISKQFDELSVEIKKMESIYRQKITALEELKKSILRKAFSGELAGARS